MGTFWGQVTPGCLYDLTLRDADNDQITIFSPSRQQGDVSHVRIISHGHDGVAAVETVVSAESNGGLHKRHEYSLRDDWQGLLIVTALENDSGEVKTINPADAGGIAGIDTIGVMAGTRRRDAACQFVDIAFSQAVQEDLARTLKVGPMNLNAAVPAELEGRPGILTTPDDWKRHAYVLDDEQRAKLLPEWKEWFNANIGK